MHNHTTRLSARLGAYLLALVLVITSGFLPISSPVSADTLSAAEATKLKPTALRSLEDQVKGLKDDQVVPLLVELSEDASVYENVQDAELYSASALRSVDARARQAAIAEATQNEVLDKFAYKRINFELLYRLNLLTNGFTGRATVAQAKEIARMPQVKSVEVMVEYSLPAPQIRPAMNNSSGQVHAPDAYANGYDGRGSVVAVLDTGTDPEHKDFHLDGPDAVGMRWTKDKIDALVVEGGKLGHGKWFSNKIPYGYNYYKQNNEIKETAKGASMHGMHVAGTIAANGDPEKGGIRGIAPKAQILGMAIFNEQGSTDGSIYLPAIEDAVKLGADSVNMSLGSPAGVVSQPGDRVVEVIKKANDIGCVVNIAAGNESQFGFGASNPRADEPDYAVVGSPAVETGSLAVASVNNLKATMKPVELVGLPEGDEHRYAAYNEGKAVPLTNLYNKELEFVDCGIGKPEQIPASVKGKVALIERGELTFVQKINNAAEKGAVLAIIYNHEQGGEDFVNMAVDKTTIPSLSVKRSDGLYMKNEYHGKIAVRDKMVSVSYGTAGRMSEFSSWGMASNGDLKPEITAPGGNIYSTLNDNQYGNMSGTSMATPHVAGGTALVAAYAKKAFPTVTGMDRAILVKNLLMSTAVPHVNRTDELNGPIYTSPRNQGAGVMELGYATSSKAIAVGTDEGFGKGLSKVVLGDLAKDSFSVNVTVVNYGSQELRFTPNWQLNTDEVKDGYFTLNPRFLAKGESNEITVPAASAEGPGSVQVSIPMDASKFAEELSSQMPNGYYLEGFVFFNSLTDGQPDISIPFVGFRGVWNDIPVLEKFIYEFKDLSKDHPTYYDETLKAENVHFTHFYTTVDENNTVIGETTQAKGPRSFSADHLAFSPNGDGKADFVGFRGVFTRNFHDFQIQVLKDQKVIAQLPPLGDEGHKNFFSNNPEMPKSYASSDWVWTGLNDDDKKLDDGVYTLHLVGRAISASEDSPLQDLGTYSFHLDTQAPAPLNPTFDKDTGVLSLNMQDGNGSGVKEVTLTNDGLVLQPQEGGTYLLAPDDDLSAITVVATDYAHNEYVETLEEILHPSPKAKISITGATTDQSAAPKFQYDIFRVTDDGEEKVEPAEQYKLGTYKIVVTKWDGRFVLENKEQTVTLTEQNKTYDVVFTFSPDTREYGSITVSSWNTNDFESPFFFVITNDKTGETYNPADSSLGYEYTSEVPYGTYTVKPAVIPDGAYAEPAEAHVTVNADTPAVEVPINFYPEGQVGTITPSAVAGDSDIDVSSIEYEYYHVDSSTDIGRGTDVPYGTYIVSPINFDDSLFCVPNYSTVQISQENPTAAPSFTFYKKTPERTGSIEIELTKKNPAYPDPNPAITFEVEDYYGNKYTDLSALPYGTYFIAPSNPGPGYYVSLSGDDLDPQNGNTAIITISKENPKQKASFTLVNFADISLTGNLYVSLHRPDKIKSAPITVTLKGLTHGTRTVETKTILAAFDDTPYDDYQITLSGLPDGYYAKPEVDNYRFIKGLVIRHFEIVEGVRQRTVTFDAQNGTDPTKVKVDDKSAVAEPAEAPVKEGYTFTGWYTSPEATPETKYVFTTPVTGDLTLYAGWTANVYDVTLNFNDGRPAETVQVTHGETLARPADPTRAHYDFRGWTTDAEGQTPYDFAAPVKGAFTLYAQWTQIPTFNVTFDRQDGTTPFVIAVERDSLISAPATEREGYEFLGWFDDAEGTKAHDFTKPVTGELTVYASWKINVYNVNATLPDGTVTKLQAEYGSTVQLPEITAPEGSTFKGWFIDGDLNRPFDPATVITGDLNLTAVVVKNPIETFTVTFNPNNKTDAFTVKVNAGDPVERPKDPTPMTDDIVFDGWYADEKLTVPFDFSKPISADTSVYAKWVAKTPAVEPLSLVAKNKEGEKLAAVRGTTATVEPTWTFHADSLGSKGYATDKLDAEAFDFYLTDANGKRVQPKGAVEVLVNLPERFRNVPADQLKLYHDNNGALEEISFRTTGNSIAFKANHFSVYVIGRLVQAKPVTPVNPVKPVEPIKPVEPVKPVKPVNPVKPVEPVKPSTPSASVKPVKPSSTSPKTGDPGIAILAGTMLLSAAGWVELRRRGKNR